MKTLTIGCFEVTELAPGRWKVRNTLTTFEHVTYGTEDEVREQLGRQSDQWKTRFSGEKRPTQRGSAWRNKPPIEPKKKPEDV